MYTNCRILLTSVAFFFATLVLLPISVNSEVVQPAVGPQPDAIIADGKHHGKHYRHLHNRDYNRAAFYYYSAPARYHYYGRPYWNYYQGSWYSDPYYDGAYYYYNYPYRDRYYYRDGYNDGLFIRFSF